eukprot:CAMPEP_0174954186 /NCGR_PEP_ID=MMETSP0004_2-20121128/283_1 /TAXON_ID=420556 /ORGANISM="Ochromonas sp., Strain CCMP1393" /LENGTH=216 /DNA_ID=CAMNT_0016201969 /DNA_START=74 /DNA_END=724 /DNA_ORIENTATION=-
MSFGNSKLALSTARITIEEAKAMPKNYDQMPNDILLSMAIMGDQDAREERLIREIMSVDNCSWEEAEDKFITIVDANRKGLFMATLPYKIGIFTAVSVGILSIPLIFEYNSVLWFNEAFVTTDVPDEKDLETPLEVGAFAWNWMEPPLGQASFFLLCMQYARAQMQNLGIAPYTEAFKARRAARLIREFPQYNQYVLESFSMGDPLDGAPINRDRT